MTKERTITGDELTRLTGLTDRRHRQLAKDGHFPPPDGGEYKYEETIRGLFKYYQERNDSMRDKKEQIEDEKHRKLKLENDEFEGLLKRTSDLQQAIAPALERLRKVTYDKLQLEMPKAAAGMDIPQARIFGGRLADDLMIEWGKVFKAWAI